MDEQGNWQTDQEKLKDLALKFFSRLFTSDRSSVGEFIKGKFPILTPYHLMVLEDVHKEE